MTAQAADDMASAVFELVILGLPSLIYVRRLRRSGGSRRQALTAVGLQPGTPSSYALALALVIPVTALAAILLQLIPTSVLHGGSKNIVGAPSTAGDYTAIVLLALAMARARADQPAPGITVRSVSFELRMAETITYPGATESELRRAPKARRLIGLADQRQLFTHRGMMRLQSELLELGGWREIPRTTIQRAEHTFTDAYTRFMAGGIRGNSPSLGFLGSLGKPLVLSLADEDTIYLLLGYRWWAGTNQARAWAPQIQRWITRTTSGEHQ